MNAIASANFGSSDLKGHDALSIALIGPDKERREEAARVLAMFHVGEVREFASYPADQDKIDGMLNPNQDVVILDLDSNPDFALQLVERICVKAATTVMVLSAHADPNLIMRSMRAGAREFLTFPLLPAALAEALMRAASRRPAVATKKPGKLLAFIGSKGGSGVTTIACSFAVALSQESGQSVLLIDLDLPLGDVALNMGVVSEFSTISALQAFERLDLNFLSQLVVKHSSGISVLAAPGQYVRYEQTAEAINKLLSVARHEYDYVVVDAGSRLNISETVFYTEASTIYLVTQTGISELRNSNRIISEFFNLHGPKLEVVLSRFEPRAHGVSEEHISRALTRPADWKIPNDTSSVQRMKISATPLTMLDSPISRLIRKMARCAAGLPEEKSKRKSFSLFG